MADPRSAASLSLRLADCTRRESAGAVRPSGLVWMDLRGPASDALDLAARWSGLRMPDPSITVRTAPSQRLRRRPNGLAMSLPLPALDEIGAVRIQEFSALLGPDLLVTLRQSDGPAFDRLGDVLDDATPPIRADSVLLHLLESLVASVADILAQLSADLAPLSRRAFASPVDLRRAGRRAEVELQVVLRSLGRLGDNLGMMLDALGWLDSVPEFLRDHSGHTFGAPELARIGALDRDIEGLRRQAEDSTLRTQMLIDATMGAINLRQGAVVKVLSVVATVFLPPTLIASAYGMNFANMPELDKPWGYPLAVVAMAASAVLPYIYMKWRGWL